MKKRLNYDLVEPKAYGAMDALDTFVNDSSIDNLQRELIKIRASQLNGCAYCVDAHSHDALTAGASLQKVLFQYAIIWNPTIEQEKEGQKSKLVKGIETILANDEKAAMIRISREIPEEYIDQTEQLNIAIRPF